MLNAHKWGGHLVNNKIHKVLTSAISRIILFLVNMGQRYRIHQPAASGRSEDGTSQRRSPDQPAGIRTVFYLPPEELNPKNFDQFGVILTNFDQNKRSLFANDENCSGEHALPLEFLNSSIL